MVTRSGSLWRTVWILALVLILAGGLLGKIHSDRPAFDFALGGPLLPYTPDQIDGLLLTRGGAQYRLDRTGDGVWTLTGAVTDFVEVPALENFLKELTAARGGGLLPGTEPEDRRYEFNGPDAIRLTVFTLAGERTRLALGVSNPVTGLIYAFGAGRRACFPVTPEFRQALVGLPDAVRTQTLLPPFPLQSVTGVEIKGGRSDTRLIRQDGLWWLRAEDPALDDLGPLTRSYQALYRDRRREREDGLWILADSGAVNLLVYEISSLIVREFVPAARAEANLADWNLDPPNRLVTLSGSQLNPDPRYGDPGSLVIAFGLSLDGKLAPVRRLENVLLTDELALRSLEKSAADLVEIQALTFPAVLADSIQVLFQGREVLRGHRDPDQFARLLERKGNDLDRVGGRLAWVIDFPVFPVVTNPPNEPLHIRVRSLVVELDRLPILTVLPPAAEDGMFAEDGRSRITVFMTDPEGPRSEVLEFGWLEAERLPPGSPPLARSTEGERPAGLWLPRTGQLLQVPPQTLVTIRNFGRQDPD